MSDITQFNFNDHEVRTVTINDEPWFVLNDLAKVLGIASVPRLASRLDDDMRQTHTIADRMGRPQNMTIVSEAGMYDVIVRSDSPLAKPFRRWVTAEVLPQIRKTGSYGVQEHLTRPELMARALIEAQATLEAKDKEIRTLTPKAEAFDGFIGSSGDYSVNETAKLLQRRGVDTGQNRLMRTLESWGWVYRGARNSPRVMQAQIETGRLAEKTYYFIDQRTGEERAGRTSVRVTPKGVEDIFARLSEDLVLVEAGLNGA